MKEQPQNIEHSDHGEWFEVEKQTIAKADKSVS